MAAAHDLYRVPNRMVDERWACSPMPALLKPDF
jgi:hypothetical protein